MTEIMFDVIGYKTDKAPGFILKKHKNLGLVEEKCIWFRAGAAIGQDFYLLAIARASNHASA